MPADDFRMILRDMGEDAEIRRGGVVVANTQALVREAKGCVEFQAGEDIRAGDEVYCHLSERTFTIERVEKVVVLRQVHSLKAHYRRDRLTNSSPTVYGSVVNVGVMHNSAIQQHSPNATQSVAVGGAEADRAKEAIRLILEILDDLDLSAEDKAEARAEAGTAEAQLNSPKPRWEWIKSSLAALRDKVVAGITEKVGPAVVEKAEQAIEWITGTQNAGG